MKKQTRNRRPEACVGLAQRASPPPGVKTKNLFKPVAAPPPDPTGVPEFFSRPFVRPPPPEPPKESDWMQALRVAARNQEGEENRKRLKAVEAIAKLKARAYELIALEAEARNRPQPDPPVPAVPDPPPQQPMQAIVLEADRPVGRARAASTKRKSPAGRGRGGQARPLSPDTRALLDEMEQEALEERTRKPALDTVTGSLLDDNPADAGFWSGK